LSIKVVRIGKKRLDTKGKYCRFKVWCWVYDRALVTGGKRCPACGSKMYANKIKSRLIVINELKDLEAEKRTQ
jgi:formamidopyrimidine-DNA glycosylase